MRAAAQQRDSLSVVIKYAETVSVPLESGQNTGGIYRNMYNVLRQSPMFLAFQNMYDQVKLDGAKITITQRTSNNAFQGVNNPLQVVTAWDRSGISFVYATSDSPVPTQQLLSFDAIAQYSSAFVKPAMYGTFYRATRAIYPSTLEEKSQWVSTGLLTAPTNEYNTELLCSATESASIRWKPLFIMCIQAQTAASQATSLGTFTFEYSIPVTFRGLRKFKTLVDEATLPQPGA